MTTLAVTTIGIQSLMKCLGNCPITWLTKYKVSENIQMRKADMVIFLLLLKITFKCCIRSIYVLYFSADVNGNGTVHDEHQTEEADIKDTALMEPKAKVGFFFFF